MLQRQAGKERKARLCLLDLFRWFVARGRRYRRPFALLPTTLSDRGNNALQLAGDGFGDRLQRRISNMLHGYCRVYGGDLDLAASDILHDDVTRPHRSELVIGGQRLVRQWRVTRAEYPVLPEIEVELFLHRRFDIDFSQHAKAFGFE